MFLNLSIKHDFNFLQNHSYTNDNDKIIIHIRLVKFLFIFLCKCTQFNPTFQKIICNHSHFTVVNVLIENKFLVVEVH